MQKSESTKMQGLVITSKPIYITYIYNLLYILCLNKVLLRCLMMMMINGNVAIWCVIKLHVWQTPNNYASHLDARASSWALLLMCFRPSSQRARARSVHATASLRALGLGLSILEAQVCRSVSTQLSQLICEWCMQASAGVLVIAFLITFRGKSMFL